MIVDKLSNIHIYKGISSDIFDGLQYLQNVTPKVEVGIYTINNNVKAIVSEYKTAEKFERGYEAHKHVIDIQYPIIGLERVKWSPLDNMSIKTPYNEQKDCGYYADPSQETYVDIGNGIFAIMFPNDAHCPQLFVNKPELIKKITIKINC
jgi:YhcH/YjgK/YiaL family protein